MQLNLYTLVRPGRVRCGQFRFPVLVLGLCTLTFLLQHAALGQAQMRAAESCFDEGPDNLPAIPNTPIPSLRPEIPARIAALLQPAHTQPAQWRAAGPAHMLSQNTRPRSNGTSTKKAPEGTLTAAR